MTVVFKLGGSLLKVPDLRENIGQILKRYSTQRCLIVAGGGAMADVVREWSTVHHLTDESAHWLAIACLEINGRLLQNLFGWTIVRSRDEANSVWDSTLSPVLLDVQCFAKTEEGRGAGRIPHDWSVTSDSLAAWITMLWPADELILLKSASIPTGQTAWEASENQLVDSYFPKIACRLNKISWCNVRQTYRVIEPWLANSADSI